VGDWSWFWNFFPFSLFLALLSLKGMFTSVIVGTYGLEPACDQIRGAVAFGALSTSSFILSSNSASSGDLPMSAILVVPLMSCLLLLAPPLPEPPDMVDVLAYLLGGPLFRRSRRSLSLKSRLLVRIALAILLLVFFLILGLKLDGVESLRYWYLSIPLWLLVFPLLAFSIRLAFAATRGKHWCIRFGTLVALLVWLFSLCLTPFLLLWRLDYRPIYLTFLLAMMPYWFFLGVSVCAVIFP